MSPNQLRAARLLVSMTQENLAEAAKVARATINRYESGKVVGDGQIRLMQYALEAAGIVFLPEGTLVNGSTVIDGVAIRGQKGRKVDGKRSTLQHGDRWKRLEVILRNDLTSEDRSRATGLRRPSHPWDGDARSSDRPEPQLENPSWVEIRDRSVRFA